MKTFLMMLIFVATSTAAYSQDSSNTGSRLRISLLTCTPGEDLYATFGHSALRIIDSNSVNDLVYNYGTFDFNDEGFYIKFARGKLRYFVSLTSFTEFIYEYQVTGRGITEQILDLSPAEKLALQHALNENLKEENKFYAYDFFLDNCTTRLRDLIVAHKHPVLSLPPVMPENFRFRQAIHQYLDSNKKYWSKLGIDLLLGARTDQVMTSVQQEFLPDNLMLALDKATPGIVNSKAVILPAGNVQPGRSLFTPGVCFTLLLGVYVVIFLLFSAGRPGIVDFFDRLLFFSTGLMGVILLLMWFATDHIMTKDNYNLLWAWPFHIIVSFIPNWRKQWIRKYFAITGVSMIILLLVWHFLPQQMNNALVPFVILVGFRALAIYLRRKPHAKQNNPV